MTSHQHSSKLLYGILLGIGCGVLLGGFWPQGGLALQFVGDLFIKALLSLVVPLVMTSMICGVSGIGDVRHLGGMGTRSIIYFVVSTALAAILGLVIVSVIKPGAADTHQERVFLRGGELREQVTYTIEGKTLRLEGDTFRRSYTDKFVLKLHTTPPIMGTIALPNGRRGALEPKNPTDLKVSQWAYEDGAPAPAPTHGTGLTIDLAAVALDPNNNKTMGAILEDLVTNLVPKNIVQAMVQTDVLPLIVFSLILGAVLSTLGPQGQPALQVFNSLNMAIMGIVGLLMKTAPIGIGCLLAGRLGEHGGFAGFLPELMRIGKFIFTVILGLVIHSFIVIPALLKGVGRVRVGPFARNLLPALTTAFSTSSSSATMPLTMQALGNWGISQRVCRFFVPLSTAINLNGTALYEAVSALFIAQIYGVDLTIPQMILVFISSTLAAVGAAGIPEAGLVTMVLVLRSAGLPLEGVSLVIIADWFLDRCRTVTNVWSDAAGTAIIERFEDTPAQGTAAPTHDPLG